MSVGSRVHALAPPAPDEGENWLAFLHTSQGHMVAFFNAINANGTVAMADFCEWVSVPSEQYLVASILDATCRVTWLFW